MASPDLPNPRRSRLRTSLLWVLAAVLGAGAVASLVTLVHDTSQRRKSLHLLLATTGRQVAALTSARLEVLTLATLDGGGSAVAPLPVAARFHVDLATGAVQVTPRGGARDGIPTPAMLADIARAEAARAGGVHRPAVHLRVEPAFRGRAVVTLVRFGAGGAPVAVDGLVADARALATTLFSDVPGLTGSANTTAMRDPLAPGAIVVTASDSTRLFGVTSREPSHVRAVVLPQGALAGLTISIGLSASQVLDPFVLPGPRGLLWTNGGLIVATVLTVVIAATSSRREVELARARSDFIAGVSHDLRMPLAQILLAGETLTLGRERDAAERTTLAHSIVREARRLVGLVDNVLLFSRSGAVALRPRLQVVAVRALLDDVVESTALTVRDRGQSIEACAPDALALLGDRQLLRQALVNLVDNALKYGGDGQHIRLAAAAVDGRVRIHVDDEGPGVPALQRGRVFEAYERLSRDQSSERTGTGLGLAVVQQIVRACRGRAWLDAAPSGGTRVVLELRAPAAGVPEAA